MKHLADLVIKMIDPPLSAWEAMQRPMPRNGLSSDTSVPRPSIDAINSLKAKMATKPKHEPIKKSGFFD
jgi:hypothetical protein